MLLYNICIIIPVTFTLKSAKIYNVYLPIVHVLDSANSKWADKSMYVN